MVKIHAKRRKIKLTEVGIISSEVRLKNVEIIIKQGSRDLKTLGGGEQTCIWTHRDNDYWDC